MAKRRERSKKGWKGDPYVGISPKWLRAVLTELDVTVAELARRTKDSEQTLAHLVKGDEPKRTRASRRRAIAKALRVPEETLEGSGRLVRGERVGYEARYSARTSFAMDRLLRVCSNAVVRDIARLDPESRQSDGADFVELDLVEILTDLITVGSWRERLIQWDPPRHPRQGYVEPLSEDLTGPFWGAPVRDPRHEEGILALIGALEHILAPWVEGQARLDYAALRELASMPVPRHTAERMTPLALFNPAPPIFDSAEQPDAPSTDGDTHD